MRRKSAFITGLFVASATFAAKEKPNVIVIYTDDYGYADLGINGQEKDVKTPNLDQLARDGALCTEGHVTAPQCSPSRAGMLTGRYQQRFGFDSISCGPLPLSEKTLGDRMKACGYRTGMIGKWHLAPNWACKAWVKDELGVEHATARTRIPFDKLLQYYPQNRGFDEFYKGEIQRYWINYGLDGKDRKPTGEWVTKKGFRIDTQTAAALAFIDRNKAKPFFLYLAYFAPHVPPEATKKYLSRFPGKMPERRRYALAMISAVDDGVGAIRERLRKFGLDQNTLIIFASDNGAPLKIDKADIPISFKGGAWDGSLNTPWVGEKGMVMDGGIHVPYVVTWPGHIPAGTVYTNPVSTLDFSPTCLAAAGQPIPKELDGVDLLPYLTGKTRKPARRDLFWRFWDQAAVRQGNWKYIRLDDGRERLFNMASPLQEKQNLLARYPEKAQELRAALKRWAQKLKPAGLRNGPLNSQEKDWYEYYLNDSKKVKPVPSGPLPARYAPMDTGGDDMLTEAEYVDGRTKLEKPLLMKKLNLTEEQYQVQHYGFQGNYRADFRRKDVNKDGVLNADELK